MRHSDWFYEKAENSNASLQPAPPLRVRTLALASLAAGNIRGLSKRGVACGGLRHGQANLDGQSSAIPVPCPHISAMQADRPFGDRQTQTHSTGVAFAGIVQAVERLEQLVQLILGHSQA